jgi:hypothetical protein
MKLTGDLQSPWLIHAKGVLFLIAGLMAAGLILLELPSLRIAGLLLITVWAFCRFYYYLFYVLERYLGHKKRFAGVFDALCSLLRPKRRNDKDS